MVNRDYALEILRVMTLIRFAFQVYLCLSFTVQNVAKNRQNKVLAVNAQFPACVFNICKCDTTGYFVFQAKTYLFPNRDQVFFMPKLNQMCGAEN